MLILVLRFVVQVIAIDEDETRFRSTATVTIYIKDTNDNSPKFPQDPYKLNVAEHSPAGTVIATITVSALLSELLLREFELACEKLCYGTQWRTHCFFLSQATDPDTMDQGNITYKLLPDSMCVYT